MDQQNDTIIWKNIRDFPNYDINNLGQIRNNKSGYIKKPSISKRGYSVVSLQNNWKQYLKTIHRLIAIAFIDNPYNKPEINHIDGDKTNYKLTNLEWCTTQENNIHMRKTGLHTSDGDKQVAQYDKNWNLIKIYKSVSAASRELNLNRANICNVCRGNTRLKTVGGYYWRYV